jgi:HEPN domain-containing protein
VGDYAEAEVWMNLAQRDYDIAVHLQKTFIPLPVETICFHCQQTVEKALKAILAYYENDIPKTHNIRTLAELCKEHTNELLIDDKSVDTVTAFAVITRYIEDRRDFTEDTAKFALNQAKQNLERVNQALEKAEQGEAPEE